jgi:hypothetical protein
MDENREPGRGVAFANTIVWGAITLMMAGASALSAYASFNSAARGEIGSAVMTAGMTVVAAAIGTAAGYVARGAAREAFGKAARPGKQELPPHFKNLFDESDKNPRPPSIS